MTTIITKNGNGTPPSLEVGELAIDKSEPALYTNTGSGIEKIGGGKSGGGGGFGAITSWPNASVDPNNDWRNPRNVSYDPPSGRLGDMININSGGYLLALEMIKRTNSKQNVRCKITVDGRVIKDMNARTDGDDLVIVFWPPMCNAMASSTTPYANGSIPPSFPLRFESSLRVEMGITSGEAIGNFYGQYVLA